MHHSEKTMRSSKQLKTRESASTCLPSDILFDILARLPIKSIIRFVCISKAWKFIIKDPKFIKLYNEIHADELSPNTLIYEHEESLWSMDLDNKREWRCQPLNRRSEDSLLVGSCNGLLCYSSDKGEHVAILNPMTRTRFVPDGNTTDIHSSALIGFGYAGFSDDYKVIRISRAKKADDHQIVEITMVDVYSLNKDSWQSCQLPWSTDQYGLQLGFLRYSYQRSSAVVYNAVHWLVEKSIGKNKNHVIIAFDLRYVGKHWEVVVPPQFLAASPQFVAALNSTSLKVLGGYLSLWSSNPSYGLELWMMREYGVIESWTRIVKLDPNSKPPLCRFIRVIQFFEARGRILVEYPWVSPGQVFWYDLKDQKCTFVEHPKDISILGPMFYAERFRPLL